MTRSFRIGDAAQTQYMVTTLSGYYMVTEVGFEPTSSNALTI